jgi:hypothetical protein
VRKRGNVAKGRTIRIIAAGTAALLVLLILLITPVATNLWLLAIEPVYVIPAESTIFTFEPTVMNPGSGDWWIYGEDRSNFYHFTGENPSSYVSYSRKLAAQCTGFEPTNHDTWCVRN